jgi:hypothetical protein
MAITLNGSTGLTANDGSVFTDASGNVGIGTGSPANLLHVATTTASNSKLEQTSTAANYLTLRSSGSDRAYLGLENSVGTGLFGSGSAYGLSMGTTGATRFAFATNGTIRMRINPDGGILSQPTGGGTLIEQFGCRAWVNFNGSSIRASGNVSSVSINGTGDYTINYSTAMPDANYAVLGTAGGYVGDILSVNPVSAADTTTSSVRVEVGLYGSLNRDMDMVSIAIVR